MPEGITAILNNPRDRMKFPPKPKGKPSSKKKAEETFYYIVRNTRGKRVYEGRIGPLAKKYKITVSHFRELEKSTGQLDNGYSFEKVFDKNRPMERLTTIYTVTDPKTGVIVAQGRHQAVKEELDLHASELNTQEDTVKQGTLSVTWERKFLPVE